MTTVAGGTPDARELRRVLGHFASGVTVITATDGDVQLGFTCQSFSSVSLDPPLVLICPAKTSTTWPRIERSGSFTVNVLAEDQEDLGRLFASRVEDRFAEAAWQPTPWGPRLDGALATLSCDVDAVHEAGDHYIVVGAVRELVTHREDGPLMFFRGQFGGGWPWA